MENKVYTKDDVLRLAKRYNNTKRQYLLVNPLQAKHMAVSPTKALELMRTLGRKLYEKYPDTKLIIGFAETATAISAAAAQEIPGCKLVNTTREPVPEANGWLYFSEEHSHAVEQKLCTDRLAEYAKDSDTIILIDDEISTGKTLLNIVKCLRTIDGFQNKIIVAASIISRLSEENRKRLAEEAIVSECLIELPEEDYTAAVADIAVEEPATLPHTEEIKILLKDFILCTNPRIGVPIDEHTADCISEAELFIDTDAAADLKGCKDILVLGTEECMYPALIFGEALEKTGLYNVKCHATTRSPIGISKAEGYPIREGYKLRSFYEYMRDTYIYNPDRYDAVIIVTDGRDFHAVSDLMSVFGRHGEPKFIVLEVQR